ncbi:MAG TPA: hypothetical protein VFM32_00325 [Spongiibacteraceae bacterium]|nr:hypothetical protein [Spongiibacteraceae bacterium]
MHNSVELTSSHIDARVERKNIVLAQTLLVAALIILPLIYTLVPPLEDYPNHLARMFILAQHAHNDFLSHFYDIVWAPIPNLIMDLVVPPLVPLFGVYTAGRIFIGATLLLMLLGPMFVHRAIYRTWSAWPLVGGLFVYNGFLFVGLMNYLFGVGVAVLGLAAWITLSERSIIIKILVSFLCCTILYVCHAAALAIYGLGIASFEAWQLWQRKSLKVSAIATSACALLTPFIPFVYIVLHSPTWGLVQQSLWESQGKLQALEIFLSVYSDYADIPFLALIIAAIATAIRRKLVRFHPAGVMIAAVLAIAFWIMPRQAFGSWMADQRLVVGIFFMSLGFISVDLHKLEKQNFFFTICLVAIAFRVVDVSVNWSALSQPMLELKNALHSLPPGSRLFVAQVDNLQDGTIDDALSHAPNLAVIERSALVSRLFTVEGKQIVHAHGEFHEHVDTEDGDTPTISQALVNAKTEPPPGADSPYWDDWEDFYDYLIVLGTDPEDTNNPAPDILQLLHIGRGFDLYKIKH